MKFLDLSKLHKMCFRSSFWEKLSWKSLVASDVDWLLWKPLRRRSWVRTQQWCGQVI